MTQPLLNGWKLLGPGRTSIFPFLSERIELTSAILLEYPKWRRVYPRPNNGPLAVFRGRSTAVNFVHRFGSWTRSHMTIVPCRYKESSCTRFWVFLPPSGQRCSQMIANIVPPGTAYAEFITCLE